VAGSRGAPAPTAGSCRRGKDAPILRLHARHRRSASLEIRAVFLARPPIAARRSLAISAPLWIRARDSARLEKWLPLFELPAAAEQDLRGHRPLGTKGPACEAHVRLLRCLPAFAQIAHAARRHEVLPRVVAAARSRHDVVDVELAQRRAL